MKIITVVALFAVLLAGTAFAGDNGNGCKLQGTWTAEVQYPHPTNESGWYWLKFFATYHGTGDNEGTWAVDWINPVPFPGQAWSNGRGIWKKVGPNKYSYTALVHGFDTTTGDTRGGMRWAGIMELTACNTINVTGSWQGFDPDMIPETPCYPAIFTLHRMLPEEPCCQP
jgi:hypothetical protein